MNTLYLWVALLQDFTITLLSNILFYRILSFKLMLGQKIYLGPLTLTLKFTNN